ncbi:MAG: helix-turn-helix transcriptional regulator [Lachnospira sp.]|nr:helix-turn-helix transcriptional regulator [Lachnospira sp.]
MLYSWHIIGNRIRNNRKEKGLSQEQLAEYLEQITENPTKRQTVAGWENGKPIKKIEQLTALCEIFNCDMAYLLCECDTKHIRTQNISSSTGLSEKAIDILISLRKMDSKLPDTISKILENKNLLYRIHDCCSADYNNSYFETSYNELFSSTQRHVILSPEKLEQVNLMMLYNSLRDFVNNFRNATIEKNANSDN